MNTPNANGDGIRRPLAFGVFTVRVAAPGGPVEPVQQPPTKTFESFVSFVAFFFVIFVAYPAGVCSGRTRGWRHRADTSRTSRVGLIGFTRCC